MSRVTDGIFSALQGASYEAVGAKRGTSAYFVVLHKINEGCALNLHRLPLPVIERQNEVKEVGFPQVGGRLLLKVGPGQGDSAAQEETWGTPDRGKERKTPCYQRAHTNTGEGQGSWSRSRVLGLSDPFAIRLKERGLCRGAAVATGAGWRLAGEAAAPVHCHHPLFQPPGRPSALQLKVWPLVETKGSGLRTKAHSGP